MFQQPPVLIRQWVQPVTRHHLLFITMVLMCSKNYLNRKRMHGGRLGLWACLENPRTDDRAHRHKRVAAVDRSKKYFARCDKEITLAQRVRTDLDKKLIALRSRESFVFCWFSFFLVRTRVIFQVLTGAFNGYSLSREVTPFPTHSREEFQHCFVVHCLNLEPRSPTARWEGDLVKFGLEACVLAARPDIRALLLLRMTE